MGSSLLLKGGTSTPKSIVETISASHSFVVGDVVRYDVQSGTWVKAKADTAENAEVAGVVSSAGTGIFDVTYSGYISVPSLAGVTSPVMFLDSTVAGGLSINPPSAIGTVIKPVLTKTTSGQGFVVTNYLGTQIGGSSTVAIDEIQPVGTIMPFAGNIIPDTWLECDGNPFLITEYPELYSKLLYTTGDKTPHTGYRARLIGTGLNEASFVVGDTIQFKSESSINWTQNAEYGDEFDSNANIIARILTVSATEMTVAVIPTYDETTKTFQYPNLIFKSGSFASTKSGTGNYRVLGSGGVFRTLSGSPAVTSVQLTHFLTPQLRGRVLVGVNSTATSDNTNEGDASFINAVSVRNLGQFGGEEQHILTVGEIPAHSHSANASSSGSHTHFNFVASSSGSVTNVNALTSTASVLAASGAGSGSDFSYGMISSTGTPTVGLGSSSGDHSHSVTVNNTGSNTAHNNMPPYLAMRYIIKAKSYTRAALIDAIDLPYPQLLVGDLRDGSIRPGGNGEDLLFRTNNGSGGTERMRLTNAGNLGIGVAAPATKLEVGGSARVGLGNDYQFDSSLKINGEGGGAGGYMRFYANTTEKMRINTNGLNIRGSVVVSDRNATPTGTTNLAYNRMFLGGTAPALMLWDDGSSLASGRVSRLGLGSRSVSASSTLLSGGFIDGGNEDTTTNSGFLRFNTTPADGSSNVERMRINSSGRVGIGTSTPAYLLDVSGDIRSTGKIISSATSSTDSSTTLTTKGYVDAKGITIFPGSKQVLYTGQIVYTPTLNYTTTRQTLQLASAGLPFTATYAIITWHHYSLGNTQYDVWVGPSTVLNSGHRVTWATTLGSGDAITSSTQMMVPIHKVSSTDIRIYWNFSGTPGTGNDAVKVDLNGYYI